LREADELLCREANPKRLSIARDLLDEERGVKTPTDRWRQSKPRQYIACPAGKGGSGWRFDRAQTTRWDLERFCERRRSTSRERIMPRFVHIDISADNPERAAAFYRQAFGWTVTRLEGPMPYWLVAVDAADPNAMGAGIGQRTESWQSTAPTIDVADADQAAAAIVAAGGSIVIPKTPIPGVGQLVTFKDTEGNVMAVLESAPASDLQAGQGGAQSAT
jgi:uncharacterized protein